jgi:heavy metal translocating P-type ATPase
MVNLRSARVAYVLPLAVLTVMVAGGLLYFLGQRTAAHYLFLAGLVATSAPLIIRTAGQALRGNFATDAVASLAILTAIILVQPFPGLVIVLMQSGGEALERHAQRRATRALSELERRAPRQAHRRTDSGFEDVPVESVRVGDHVLVRPGEVVPMDGVVREGRSHVDTAAITGEPMPLTAVPGTRLFSGFLNGERPLVVEATALAAQSQYARIVELVRTAQESKAPIQRLADRYAVWFTPFTLAVAAGAFALSGEADRILAVLVVATPCPLILATPVAVIGGMNRAARAHTIVRSGAALEQLAQVRAVVFDKTGTLTTGRPVPQGIRTIDGWQADKLLPLVAAVEQGSSHVLARSLVAYAHERGAAPAMAQDIHETAGRGVRGTVDGHQLAIGSEQFVSEQARGGSGALPATSSERLRSYIVVDGQLAGVIEFEDQLRPDLGRLFAGLRAAGIQRIIIVSGDDEETVQAVARQLDVDEAFGALKPAEKLDHVRRVMDQVGPTLMIGDGTNDAPALAAATVGLAVTGGSGDIAAETADAILLGDNLLQIGETLHIARRALRIAKQSIVVGLGLSGLGMAAAALGWLPPIGGALFQEAIDVAVIVNALRAAAPTNAPSIPLPKTYS